MPENETLRAIREFAGYSQQGAAQELGLHPTTWTKRELGLYPIPPGFLARVRVAFGPRIRERAKALVGEEVVALG